jgi:uncharacterized membrane-anchored protein YhcB (DUF1043 family)
MHAKSIVFTHMSYGFTAYEDKQARPPGDADAKSVSELKIKTLAKANQSYMQQRLDCRNRLLRANMSLITDFVILIFGPSMLKRIDAASPSVPERMVLRLPVEKSGNIVDVDRALFATQTDMEKAAQELLAEVKQKTGVLREMLAREKKPASQEIDQAAGELKNAELILHRTTQIKQAMKNTHGDRQILLHVVEKGCGQDEGVTIDMLYTLTIPYDLLRQKLAVIEKQLALEKAESATRITEKEQNEVLAQAEAPTQVETSD